VTYQIDANDESMKAWKIGMDAQSLAFFLLFIYFGCVYDVTWDVYTLPSPPPSDWNQSLALATLSTDLVWFTYPRFMILMCMVLPGVCAPHCNGGVFIGGVLEFDRWRLEGRRS
jgi:hypothetical protein